MKTRPKAAFLSAGAVSAGRFLCVLIIIAGLCGHLKVVTAAELGVPPVFPEYGLGEIQPESPPFSAASPFLLYDTPQSLWIDTQNLDASRNLYLTDYLGSRGVNAEWTGNHADCAAGTTSTAFQTAVLQRINYFRAMAGIPPISGFDPQYSQKAQAAALMMSVNRQLSHTPETSWTCYTADGRDGAGSSNLYLGVYGAEAISGYIRDPGFANYAVGHRRWILYPQIRYMGTGDIPSRDGYYSANALWVFDQLWGARPATRDGFVAWPPPGYVPSQVVYPRWSLAYPRADFHQADVTMTRNGTALSLKINPIVSGYGENTLVWEPTSSLFSGAGNIGTYHITVGNVMIAGTPTSFTYTVTVFDPHPMVQTYTVTPSAGTGGSLLPDTPQTVAQGQTTTFTVTADTGYSSDTVSGCGGNLDGNTYTTGAIMADCTVEATFRLNSHTVTGTAGAGGRVEPDSHTVNHGSTATFRVSPDTGHHHAEVGGSCPAGSFSGNTYTTGAILADCHVMFTFSQYGSQYGSLHIFIEPPAASAAGAQWRRTGTTAWYDSGDMETDVPVGSHTVAFKDVTGWTKPASLSVTIASGETTTATGTYTSGHRSLELWGMGQNIYGQLGDGTSQGAYTPIRVQDSSVAGMAAGFTHSLFVTPSGELWAMGANGSGQLGDGTTEHRFAPVRIRESGVAGVAAGSAHSLFVTPSGELWAMGANGSGQLGDGTTEHRTAPVRIRESGVAGVAAGAAHSLFVTTSGELWAMGGNGSGQLGDGTTEHRTAPVRIRESGVAGVAAGSAHSLFVISGGELWAMGANRSGQLGDGTIEHRFAPVRIRESGVAAVAAGGWHSLFVTTSGELWAMGANRSGQLGDGTTTDRTAPVRIRESGVATVAAAGVQTFFFIDGFSLFITTSGELWAMGVNGSGQLGDGTTQHRHMPVRIRDGGVAAVAAGGHHSLFATQVSGTLTVTATAGSGGSVTPASRPVASGESASFTVTPNTGHTHSNVGGTCPAGSFSGNTYTTGVITANCTVNFTFIQQTTSLSVTLEPEAARTAGAQWRRIGTSTWRSSGDTEADVPAGDHSVEFTIVAGWETLPNRAVTVEERITNTIIATYTPNSTHYQITAAASAGARGTVSGGGQFIHNTLVTLTAVPNTGYIFSHWTENGRIVPDAEATYRFRSTIERHLTAHFGKISGLPGVMLLLLLDD